MHLLTFGIALWILKRCFGSIHCCRVAAAFVALWLKASRLRGANEPQVNQVNHRIPLTHSIHFRQQTRLRSFCQEEKGQTWNKKSTHSADGEGEPGLSGAHAHEAETQLPVEQMFTDEGD